MKRFSLALLSSILAFVFVIPAFAQETFGLTATEFDGLVAANANSSAQEQWTLDYTVDFSLTGVEATPITATLSGTGALDLPNQALSLSINGTVVGGGASVPLRRRVARDWASGLLPRHRPHHQRRYGLVLHRGY
ncbi:MAG UNVERIFIED_CONTAM: hypothetical protein LVT10_18930 [Anaerolineae bacterium]